MASCLWLRSHRTGCQPFCSVMLLATRSALTVRLQQPRRQGGPRLLHCLFSWIPRPPSFSCCQPEGSEPVQKFPKSLPLKLPCSPRRGRSAPSSPKAARSARFSLSSRTGQWSRHSLQLGLPNTHGPLLSPLLLRSRHPVKLRSRCTFTLITKYAINIEKCAQELKVHLLPYLTHIYY